jgi:hypothetical protein
VVIADVAVDLQLSTTKGDRATLAMYKDDIEPPFLSTPEMMAVSAKMRALQQKSWAVTCVLRLPHP